METPLDRLRTRIFASDNAACFIERECILARLAGEMAGYDQPDRYARIFAALLAEVSTPVDPDDIFVGRFVEARPDEGMTAPSTLLVATGHMSFDYRTVLRRGLNGILADITDNAHRYGDEKSRIYAENAAIVVEAVRAFAARYADAAEAAGKMRAAQALRRVPCEPAVDFYEALQGIWLLHMIASGYVGSRDYGFGRFDRYMLPYYEREIARGVTRDEIVETLAGFFVKTNEICGRTTHNHQSKPVLCQASKQYVVFGGPAPNAFCSVILEAAERNALAQPQLTVLLEPAADPAFTRRVFVAMSRLTDKLHIYHYGLVRRYLLGKGLPDEVASDFTYSACCTFDLHHRSIRRELYVPTVQLFLETLDEGPYAGVDAIARAYGERVAGYLQAFMDRECAARDDDYNRRVFVLDGLLVGECTARCRYPEDGGLRFPTYNVFFPGLATLGDSLAALDRIVYRERRYTYEVFRQIVRDDFAGQEPLRRELESAVKFGNDTEADRYTVLAADALLTAAEHLRLPEGWLAVPGFYSLERENIWAADTPATPDGRRAGTPFSENQSPAYGADRSGLTALLNSLAKLPFGRTATGGLNLTFSQAVTPETLEALLTAYFEMGGLHAGITVLDRAALEDAMQHPERYQSLTVRLYGFSEYFVSLPPWQQLAVLNRTAYTG